MIRKIFSYIKFILPLILTIGLLINLTIKDTYYWSSLLFYAFPLSILFYLSFALLLLNFKTKKRLYCLIFWLIVSALWIKQDYFINIRTNIPNGNNTIVFWNGAKKNTFLDAFNELKSIPDILIINEYDQTNKQELKSIKTKYPNYHFQVIHKKIGIFSKRHVLNLTTFKMKNNSFMLSFDSNINDKLFHFYSIDIIANIKHFRKTMLKETIGNIKSRENTIILGDFNTPYESLHFKEYKEQYHHGFSFTGNGFINTWFWNLPILSLDHAWLSKGIPITETKHLNTWKSDHKIIKIRL
ncbi:endonuclease/exonuclease/phosphatase family protein [Pseudofulvibacter geojedonensis]|uniref:Endonuclease/exonuclease/phosphatase family protein n=1 Tax=Pseudofulvibacter geojedonensis TaxID=1123758 RepID=A0ABW3I5V9_9FLAO